MTDTQVLTQRRRASAPLAPPVSAPPAGWRVAVLNILLALPPAALTVVVTLMDASSRSLWNDEYATWHASTLPFGDLLALLDNVDAVLAPFYVFMHGWIALFGDTPLSLRVPSVIAMALAAGLIALIGRRLFDAGVGLTAGLLFAGLPAVSRYGQEARPYAFTLAVVCLATLLLLRALDQPRWLRWIGYGLCLLMVGLSHIVALTVVAAHAVFVWRVFRTTSDFRLLRWLLAVFVAATAALPMVAKGSDESDAISWIRADLRAVQQLPEKVFGSLPVALAVVAVAVLSAVLLWRSDRTPAVLLVTWAVFPPVFCYVTFPLLHLFLHRYQLFTLPAWVLLASAVVFAVARQLRGRRPDPAVSLAALLMVAAVFYLGAAGQVAARRSPVEGEPDLRGAAVTVSANMRAGDGIAFSGTERNGRRAFAYELRGRAAPRDVFVAKTARELGTFGAQECEAPGRCLGDTRRLWLVAAADAAADPFAGMSEATKILLQRDFTSAEVKRLERVRVILLTRKATR